MQALLERLEAIGLAEASEAKVIQWAKGFGSVEEFEAAIKPGHGFKKPSHVYQHMDRETKGKLAANVRATLERSPWWTLLDVPTKAIVVTHKSTMRGDASDVDLSVPIVIDEKMTVIDGRHRTTLARDKGTRLMRAWAPVSVFYRLKVKR